MGAKLRRLICSLLGCRSINLYRRHYDRGGHGNGGFSECTGWKCERCGRAFEEQWDA